jgi:hypothetical protein
LNGFFKYSKLVYVDCQDNESANIKVYPNPGTSELMLEKTNDKVIVNFEIINVLGVVVYKGSLLKKITIQTTSFAPGIYQIKLGVSKIYKWIKIE